MRALRRPRRNEEAPRLLSLALQGGGSFGAFTWGVLDRLLEEDGIAFDVLSGTSAGAVNAVLLADGLAAGGPEEARQRLRQFWKRASDAALFMPFGRLAGAGAVASAATTTLALSTQLVSPYQFNPLGLNPLRTALADLVDFERLRKASPLRLLVAATQVRNGRLRLFRETELTLDAVLASACLPLLHHAIEIEGEWYWDGGLSANPPLRQAVMASETDDVVIVQLTPENLDEVPQLSPAIHRRVSQIAFNSPLQMEIETIADLCERCRKEGLFRSRFCRKLQRLRLHRIAAEDAVDGLDRTSALNLDWAFLTRLMESGRRAAEKWLAELTASAPSQ
ncbi:MAG: patatin-like phospholipase family protein [Pseudomonadota bacterium]